MAGVTYIQSQFLGGYVFAAVVSVMALALIAVCLAKGEGPTWRWGK